MRLVEHETDLRELVCKHAAELPPQQRLIADYLLEHLQAVSFLSVPELARRVGVSEATVVRFAQRIGYAGFSELKMDLVELLQNRLGNNVDDSSDPELGDDVLHSVAELEASNIARTVDGLDREVFKGVAEAVFTAGHTFTFGMGVSAHLAQLAAYTLTQVGIRATSLSTNFSTPREQLIAMQASDLLIAFSFPPYSRQSLDLLTEAGNRGMTTVAISDRLTSPAAVLATLTIPVKTDNMMFTNAIAAITVIFNAIAVEIATSHQGHALEAFSYINRMLTEETSILPSGK
jgi:DNA-binding MurR/RpiR family transcriptional regulator